MKYYLHYIGSKLYPKDIFIKEAKTIGVNRCIPIRMIKKLKFGDKILLGNFLSKEIYHIEHCPHCYKVGKLIALEHIKIGNEDVFGCPKCNIEIEREKSIHADKIDQRKNKKNGKANIFGYFVISGLNIKASNELKEELVKKLNIVMTRNPNLEIKRQCGSYLLGKSYVVRNTIEEIATIAEGLGKIMNEEVKLFLAGQFKDFETTIEPINFTRTLIPIEIDSNIQLEDLQFMKKVGLIYNYEKRAYIKKQEKRGRPKKG